MCTPLWRLFCLADMASFNKTITPCHTAEKVRKWLEHAEGFQLLPWPLNSLDMNSIVHLSFGLEKRVRGVFPQPRILWELQDFLLKSWYQISKDTCQHLASCMPHRVKAPEERGGPTSDFIGGLKRFGWLVYCIRDTGISLGNDEIIELQLSNGTQRCGRHVRTISSIWNIQISSSDIFTQLAKTQRKSIISNAIAELFSCVRRNTCRYLLAQWSCLSSVTYRKKQCADRSADQIQRTVIRAFGVSKSVVSRLWRRFHGTGGERRSEQSRPKLKIVLDDQYLHLLVARNYQQTASDLSNE